jgi:hypothetical protein
MRGAGKLLGTAGTDLISGCFAIGTKDVLSISGGFLSQVTYQYAGRNICTR